MKFRFATGLHLDMRFCWPLKHRLRVESCKKTRFNDDRCKLRSLMSIMDDSWGRCVTSLWRAVVLWMCSHNFLPRRPLNILMSIYVRKVTLTVTTVWLLEFLLLIHLYLFTCVFVFNPLVLDSRTLFQVLQYYILASKNSDYCNDVWKQSKRYSIQVKYLLPLQQTHPNIGVEATNIIVT